MVQRPLWTETPSRQRPHQTEIPRTETPLWTKTPPDRDLPSGQRPSTATPLDRAPPYRDPPLDRDPQQRPLWTETPSRQRPHQTETPGQRPPYGNHSGRYASYWNSFLLFIIITYYLLASLGDEHVLELSKRITSGEELMDLGINGLGVPEFKIKAVMYDHSDSIHAATHELLSTWLKQQTDRQEAYMNLCASLRRCQMNQLAIQLTKWVAGTDAASQITNRGMLVVKDTNVNSPTDRNPYVEALHPHPPRCKITPLSWTFVGPPVNTAKSNVFGE